MSGPSAGRGGEGLAPLDWGQTPRSSSAQSRSGVGSLASGAALDLDFFFFYVLVLEPEGQVTPLAQGLRALGELCSQRGLK